VGGHAYEAIYPGPIGKILTPQMEGVGVRHDLLHGSSLCGACGEVCPVQIPIPEILVRLRREATHDLSASTVAGKGTGRTAAEDRAWSLWAGLAARPKLYRVATWFATRFGWALPASAPLIKDWTQHRSKPRPASKPLSERVRAEGVPHV
jgi:L-lactate dehydrogenase complex protein LldF